MFRLIKFIPICAFVFFVSAQLVFAQSGATDLITKGLVDTNASVGYATTPLPVLIGNVIKTLLGIVGVIFLVLTVYAGVLYMTAGGDTTKVDKAKKMIANSLIGLVIIIGSYAFASFVVTELGKAASANQAECVPGPGKTC